MEKVDEQKPNLISRLSFANKALLKNNWKEYVGNKHHNETYLDACSIPFEFLAFHVGPANQELLVPASLDEACAHLNFGHVFFSTSLDDLKFYFGQDKNKMVYFADLRKVGEARVQTCYKNSVLFQDDIVRKLEAFKNALIAPEEVRNSVNNWMDKYTIPFNSARISRYKKRGDYVLIRGPIKVS